MLYRRRQIVGSRDDESHLVLFGPSLVGKGKCVKSIEAEFPNKIHTVGMGNNVRKKLQNDGDFRSKYGALVRSGGRLPDSVADEIALECYKNGREAGFKCFVWDGYGRTESQVSSMIEWEVLTPSKSKFLDLSASLQTCFARLSHAKRSWTRNGRNDDEEAVLMDKYEKHMQSKRAILAKATYSGIKVIHIDADGCIESVAKKVVCYATQLFGTEEHRQKIPAEAYTPKPPYKSDTDFFHFRGLMTTTCF